MVVTVAKEACSEEHMDGCIWSLGQSRPWEWARESPGVLVTGSQICLNYEKLCPLSDKTP